MAGDNSLVITINGSAKDFLDELDKVKKKTASLEKVLSATAKASAAAFAGFAASIAIVTKAFADYETALVGVGKTTNIEGKKLQAFGKEFQKLSSEIPVATNELLGIAQAAGQLGVTGEANLIKFTETVAKLGVATDLSGEQAATALTRILNVTDEGIESIDTFGSVIVALGNNFAATESEIVRVTTEVARSTAVFGVSSAEAAALATALKSVGVQAQLGGSAVGRAFRAIDKAVREGGTALENLATVTGITGDQLKKTFEEDSTQVFQAFINGLGDIQEAGGSTTEALAAFGLKGDEILKVLPVLAKNSELVGRALNTAARETENATALNKEAAAAFNTLASTSTKLVNNFTNLKTNIGEQLAPQLRDLIESLNDVVKTISQADKETVSSIASFLKWGAIITGAIASIAAFALGAIQVSAAITAIGVAFLPATIAASGFWIAVTGPIGIAVAGIVAVTAAVVGVSSALSDMETDAKKTVGGLNQEIKALREEQEKYNEAASHKDPSISRDAKRRVALLEDEINALQKLRQEKIKSTEDFGTGQLLIRPTTDGTDPFAGLDSDLTGNAAIVVKPEIEAEAEATLKTKSEVDKRTKLIDAATAKRIEKAKLENQKLLEIQKARNLAGTDEEVALFERKAEIENEFNEAKQIKDSEERAIALENLGLKHEQELESIEEFEQEKEDRAIERAEAKRETELALRELELEERAQLTADDIASLQDKVKTENDILRQQALDKSIKQIETRNKFVKDEIKHGTVIANLNQFLASNEVGVAKNAADALVGLSRSKNATLKGIGKAAARVNAAIATAEGAIKAYTSLAGIPFVGPVLGAAAAGAVIAFGVEQQAQISAAQTGGFVPPTNGGARDRVPTMLEPGELVVPQAIAPNFIQAAGLPDTQSVGEGESAGGAQVIEIMLEDRAGEFISLEQREGRALGLIGDS